MKRSPIEEFIMYPSIAVVVLPFANMTGIISGVLQHYRPCCAIVHKVIVMEERVLKFERFVASSILTREECGTADPTNGSGNLEEHKSTDYWNGCKVTSR